MATMIDTQYYFVCLVLLFLSTLLLKSLFKKPSKTLRLPPSPPALPIIGHLHLLGSSLSQSLHKLSTKYGPLLYLRLGASQCLVVSTASLATEIFKTNDLVFSDRPSFAFSDRLPYGNYGFFSARYGDYWRFIKQLCMSELLSTQQVEQSRDVRHEEIVCFLLKALESAKKQHVFDVGAELMKLTNNSTCKLTMSMRCSEEHDEAERIRQLVKESMEVGEKIVLGDVFGPLKILAFWLYGKKAINGTLKYDAILEKVLKQHEESPQKENKDLMDILLKVYHDDKAEFKINRTHLKAFLLDLFIAGTGTSSDAMQWTIAELINHPNIFNKVREEIKTVVGTRLVEESDVSSLPYLQAVVKEALRLHPPIPVVVRETREDCKIKDFDIPEKTMVAINVYAIMRDAKIWNYPNDFQPERFLISSKEKYGMEYIPFGAGRRGCPGSKLALSMIHTTVAAMVQCFDWNVGGEGDHAKVNMQVAPSFTMPMAQPFICVPVVHFNPFISSM
uniref:Cytochrome P450 n=1 Tax=Fagus sylvatica TaxID=28930 RepID=A0A2N9GCJ7_FAGSY